MSAAKERLLAAGLRIFAEKRSKSVSVSELAREASVARSTIYNLVPDIDTLFAEVADRVTQQFNKKLLAAVTGIDDPALKLAFALALPLEESHSDPVAGRFVTEFAQQESRIRKYWFGVPEQALTTGLEIGRFDIQANDIPVFRGQMAGGLLSTMLLIRDGHTGWRDAAHCFASIQLRALGLVQEDIDPLMQRCLDRRSNLPAQAVGLRG
ncbi:MAG: helix-turn-helix domain-containing protein [Pseudomonadota bacterium]